MKPTKIILAVMVMLMLTSIATAKPMQDITDDNNQLIYFFEEDHAFNIYLKIYQSGGNHDQPLPLDNYQSIIQKGTKRTSFGWGIRLTPNRKLVAEITSNYPLEVDGYKLKDEEYNIDFQKEADNGWTIEFEEITSTHYNVIIYKPNYHGVSYVIIDPVVGANVQTVYYTFTVCGNWTCSAYGTCETTDTQPCTTVTGLPLGCENATFEGSYTALNTTCDYCTPSWTCSNYTGCDYTTGTNTCTNVTDQNDCYAQTGQSSDQFSGSLNTYDLQCGTQTGVLLSETGTGLAVLVDSIRMPVSKFILVLAIIGAIVTLVLGIVFAIKRITTKNL